MSRYGQYLLFCALVGCKTYTIAPESLKRQLLESEPTVVHTVGPLGDIHSYLANNIHTIHCLDKSGTAVELPKSPSIEVRITLSSGGRKTMYFDRIELRNDTLLGHPSRFAPAIEVRIPYTEITRIEVQDGKKDFSYR